MHIYLGSSVSESSMLTPSSENQILDIILNDEQLMKQTTRYRKILALNQSAAKTLKLQFPYFIGSTFLNDQRNSDTFLEANYMVFDIDHCDSLEDHIQNALYLEPRIRLLFTSPSKNGFKVLFKLERPCSDIAIFKQVYTHLGRELAEKISLTSKIDLKTNDATRICFLAHDPNAYYNSNAPALNWENYYQDNRQIAQEQSLDLIKLQEVKNKIAPTRKKTYSGYAPQELHDLEKDLIDLCAQEAWMIAELATIHYGKKLAIKAGYKTAEVNIFYGKRGFTIVRSPKKGTDPALNEHLYQLVHDLIFSSSEVYPNV